jgi:hypothetical protein
MTIAEIAQLRSLAADFSIEADQSARLIKARHRGAFAFYVELRRSFTDEYPENRPFSLPATILARQSFVPGRRDRKWYLRMTKELLRLDLILRIERAANRRPAKYVFVKHRVNEESNNVISFTAHRLRIEASHA